MKQVRSSSAYRNLIFCREDFRKARKLINSLIIGGFNVLSHTH